MALNDSSGRFLFGDFSFSSFKCPNCTDVCFFNDPSCFLPAPPPDSDSDNNATQTKIQIHHPSHLLPGFLIAAGALLLVSFLVFLTFYVVLKRRRCLRRQNLALPTPPHQDGDGDDAAGDGQGYSTHHVWLIRTVGLDESIIGSIATTVYKSRHGGGDCTVCLGEFKDGEMVKLLPRCTHPFHVSCIDTWLRSHVNCPLCRAPVFLATDHAQVDGGASRTGSDPHVGTLDAESDASSSSSTSASLELPKETEDNGFQPVRRSVSMDASSLASLLRNAEQAEKGHGENPRMELELCVVSGNKGKQGTALLKGRGPLAMKRSQSTRSGRFFFPRYGRGRNPILPL